MRLRRMVDLKLLRSWDDSDSSVLYCPASGDTHLLNLVDRQALACIPANRELDFHAWLNLVAAELDTEVSTELTNYLSELARQFSELGLVTSVA